MQVELDFGVDTEAIKKAKQKPVKTVKLPKGAVPIRAIDFDNGVLLDKGKYGLRATPLSINAMQKLLMLGNSGDAGTKKCGREPRSFVDSLLTIETVLNMGGLGDKSPIIRLFNRHGLSVALTHSAHGYIRRKEREFKRLMTPFKFNVPEQFLKDHKSEDEISDRERQGGIIGPYIEDKYADEINRYKQKIRGFGFDDQTKEFHLFPYQVDDVARLACKKRAFINLDMGLGKTPIAVALAHMHGHRRVLVVCPGAAIGSYESGWRHEIHRMGVPKENIHIMTEPEDLPFNYADYPDNGRPHFFITDYGCLSKDKVEWSAFICPECGSNVDEKDKGRCSAGKHPYRVTRSPKKCPKSKKKPCAADAWSGVSCDQSRGGCGFRIKRRVLTKGRQKKGRTIVDPMWKCVRRGMFQCAFFDESQMIKNASTKRGNAVQFLPGIPRRYIITGTMMTNYVQDTFWQLNLLFSGMFPMDRKLKDYSSVKGKISGEEKFFRDFQAEKGSTKRLPRLRNKERLWDIMSKVQCRRRASDPEVDTQVDLPELKLHTELVEMTEQHQMIYDMKTGVFQNEIAKTLADSNLGKEHNVTVADLSAADIEQRLEVLRLVACTPEIEPAYREDLTAKDARIYQLVDEEVKQGNKVVIFGSYVAFMEKMKLGMDKRGYSPILIDGSVPMAARWPLIDAWRTDPTRKVMIAGVRAMNYAVNFTPSCDKFKIRTAIFASPCWVPTEMEQAWKRIHRIGQTEPVTAWFIYHKNTIEQHMDDLLYKKRKTIATAMDRAAKYRREDDVKERSATEIAKIILGLKQSEKANE